MFKFYSQSNFSKKFIEWASIIAPPLLILLLVPIQPDLFTSIIWLQAIYGFIISIFNIMYSVLRIIFLKTVIIKHIIRQLLTVIIFIFASALQLESQSEAHTYARALAIEIQQKCELSACPAITDQWSDLEINTYRKDYASVKAGKWWTRYKLSYRPMNENDIDKFRLYLYIDMDTHFTFIGGKGLELTESEKRSEVKRFSEGSWQ